MRRVACVGKKRKKGNQESVEVGKTAVALSGKVAEEKKGTGEKSVGVVGWDVSTDQAPSQNKRANGTFSPASSKVSSLERTLFLANSRVASLAGGWISIASV